MALHVEILDKGGLNMKMDGIIHCCGFFLDSGFNILVKTLLG
jgi:hypothetical protein